MPKKFTPGSRAPKKAGASEGRKPRSSARSFDGDYAKPKKRDGRPGYKSKRDDYTPREKRDGYAPKGEKREGYTPPGKAR